MRKFSIEMLPAREGDCLWVEYGELSNPSRLLIDGGTSETYQEVSRRIKELKTPKVHFDLLIITHVDADHVGGVIELLKGQKIDVSFDDIWFNGYRHLPGALESFGPVQGETISTTIDEKKMPWNMKFKGRSVSVTQEGDLPSTTLAGGMKLTLLSPYSQQLTELRPVWQEECRKAGIDPSQPTPQAVPEQTEGLETFGPLDIEALATTKFEGDKSVANGSSIAVLAEYGGKKALLAGDAYPEKLAESIARLKGSQESKLKLNSFKLPHHGSKHNINQQLLQKIMCDRYLVSTNGNIHKHPDREAIARIIKFGSLKVELIFNYQNQFTQVWDDIHQKQKHGYSTIYPDSKKMGKIVNL